MRARSGAGQVAETLAFEGLTWVDMSNARAVPRLAEAWRWSEDGLRLTVTLRPNVILHNGQPLTAAVAAGILKSMMEDPENLGLYTALADVTDVQAKGPRELEIALARHTSYLPEDLSIPLRVLPSEKGEEKASPPIGTGPYQIVRQSESEIVLSRFERYYLGAPAISNVRVIPIETLRKAWTGFLRGDLGMVTDLPPDAVELLRSNDVEIVSFPRPYQYLLAFNSRNPKLANPMVRRALNLAIDREAIVERVLHGNGEPSTGPIWPHHWAYNTAVQPFSRDLQEAERLLRSAGREIGLSRDASRPPARLRFSCLIPEGFSIYERVILELQRQLYDAGVDLQFTVVPIGAYQSRLRTGDFEAAFIDMISAPSLNRPYIFWRSARNGVAYNVFGYENAEAERLFDAIRAARTDYEIRDATHRLQRVFLQDPPALFIAWNQRSRAVKREFGVRAEPGEDPLLSVWRWGADNMGDSLASR